MGSQARFEQTFTGPASAVRARIWQQIYGPEYPAWADPFSYVSVTELARILTPGGRLVLTSWDYHSQPAGRPAQVTDHRPLLDQAGFDVLSYEETHAWRDRQQQTGQALLAAAAELAAESGSTVAQQRARITEMNANMATITRRVLVTAQRRPAN